MASSAQRSLAILVSPQPCRESDSIHFQIGLGAASLEESPDYRKVVSGDGARYDRLPCHTKHGLIANPGTFGMDRSVRQTALDQARNGDVRARGDLLESYRPYVRVMVRALRPQCLSARLDDSDLIQDAMLEAHRSFPKFRGTCLAELLAWLRQVVVRAAGHTVRGHLDTAKREIRREFQDNGLSSLLAASGSSPSARAARHEQAAHLASALSHLPADMQQVLLGRHLDDLPYAALAERLGRSEGAVRVLYTRALRRLRQECQVGAATSTGASGASSL
jgi:RNA polymerase sigma-70 factor (ECF subfamily)